MEIFNIGIPELLFIFLIMLIFLGPEGFSKTARGLARMIRKLVRSPIWNDLVKAQRDIQELPTRLVREAGIEDIQQEVSRFNQQVQQDIHGIRQPVQFDPSDENRIKPEDPQTPEDFDYRAAALGAQDAGDNGHAHPAGPAGPGEEETPATGQGSD
jgi:Sec-independent protein translocase protein TatA